MSQRICLLGGAVLWLTACGAPTGSPATLKTDHDTYAPGAELELRLQNTSPQSLGYNLCFSTLQRREGGSWTKVAHPDRVFCAAVQYRLVLGERAEALRPLAKTLPEGEYRYVTTVEWNGEGQEVASNTFRVAGPPAP